MKVIMTAQTKAQDEKGKTYNANKRKYHYNKAIQATKARCRRQTSMKSVAYKKGRRAMQQCYERIPKREPDFVRYYQDKAE